MSGRRPVVKIIAESLSQHDEKHVVPNPLSRIRVGRRRTRDDKFFGHPSNDRPMLLNFRDRTPKCTDRWPI
jgi:hypothetical protein